MSECAVSENEIEIRDETEQKSKKREEFHPIGFAWCCCHWSLAIFFILNLSNKLKNSPWLRVEYCRWTHIHKYIQTRTGEGVKDVSGKITNMVVDEVMQSHNGDISAEGVRDQYADGRAAKVWELFIGDKSSRTDNYKNFLLELLREKGCRRILDVACGTGYKSHFFSLCILFSFNFSSFKFKCYWNAIVHQRNEEKEKRKWTQNIEQDSTLVSPFCFL